MSVKIVARNMQCYLVALGISIFVVLLFSGNVSAADQVPVVPPVTLQTSLASIIAQVQQGVDAGVGFLKQEIPDVIKQLLVWKAARAGLLAVGGLLVFSFGVWAVLNAFKRVNDYKTKEGYYKSLDSIHDRRRWPTGEEERLQQKLEIESVALAKAQVDAVEWSTFASVVAGVVFGLAGLFAFFNIWGNALEVLQIYLAPKVWLIEYAAELVKK